jgi:hypothetical protein
MARERREEREVASNDPSLSPEANRLLTGELREAVGAETVRVPADTPERSRESRGGRGDFATALAANRILVAITFAALLVVGVIVALATGSWWAVVVAAVVHAVGTFVVLATLANAATQTEHVAPEVAARLEEEGVPDPDTLLSDLVEEYAGADTGERTSDLVTTGANEQPADPSKDPAAATAQQRTANTPAGVPTAPAGTGSAVDRVLVKGIVAALAVIAVGVGALSPLLGVEFLLVPAIGLPACAVWLLLDRRMEGRREERAGQAGETASPRPRSRPRVLATILAIVVTVGAFVALMGWVGGAL